MMLEDHFHPGRLQLLLIRERLSAFLKPALRDKQESGEQSAEKE